MFCKFFRSGGLFLVTPASWPWTCLHFMLSSVVPWYHTGDVPTYTFRFTWQLQHEKCDVYDHYSQHIITVCLVSCKNIKILTKYSSFVSVSIFWIINLSMHRWQIIKSSLYKIFWQLSLTAVRCVKIRATLLFLCHHDTIIILTQ